jgi:Ni2+-binding GTPase involved in maturation of urease and hydrogenase
VSSARTERRTSMVVLGGFLGAGKTTTMIEAARRLEARGARVGVITNDQGEELVDTQLVRERGLLAQEVTGGCFCCRFDDLMTVARRIIDEGDADIVVAEAVGSCTDLAATVIRPLQEYYGESFRVAPLTVLVDAQRWASLEGSDGMLGELASYLFRKQLEEANVIALNKIDLLHRERLDELCLSLRREYPSAQLLPISAAEGTGIDELLELWTAQNGAGASIGGRVLDIDYDLYAAAEAEMGWLNATLRLEAREDGFVPGDWVERLLSRLGDECRERGWTIGHAKCSLTTSSGWTKASLTDPGAPSTFTAREHAPARDGELLLNARIAAEPGRLEALVRAAVAAVDAAQGTYTTFERIECFSPARPQPTHRLEALVREET